MEQIKRINDIPKKELVKRIQALDSLCAWDISGQEVPDKVAFMRRQWSRLMQAKTRRL